MCTDQIAHMAPTGTSSPTVLISSLWHLFCCGLPASNSESAGKTGNLEISRVQLAMYQTDNQTMLFVTLCAYPNWQKTSTVQSVFFMSANGQAASVSLLSRRLCSCLCSFPHCRADLVPDLTTVLIEYRPLGIPIGPYAESMLWNPCWESGTPTSVAHWVLQ